MIQIANAPCSWGVLEFDLQGEAAGFRQVLDEMAATGYAGTELGDWGFLPTDPHHLSSELRLRGLELLGAFVPVNLKEPSALGAGLELALRSARLLADVAGPTPFIILADENGKDPRRTLNAGRIQKEHGLSVEQWKIFSDGAQCIAQTVREQTGLRTVFHPHCAGYVETPAEVESLMQLTDPGLLGLCLDSGHCRFGGGDPLAALDRYAGRIWHVHFKDCDPASAAKSRQTGWDYFTSIRRGLFCELGQGEIDFPALKAGLKAHGYQGWIVVEQDVLPGMGSPLESARRNRRYMASIGF